VNLKRTAKNQPVAFIETKAGRTFATSDRVVFQQEIEALTLLVYLGAKLK